MKINHVGSSGVNPYKRQMNKPDVVSKPTNKSTDKVEISSTAKEMQQISSYAAKRQERVDELKIQIENGSYKINPNDIAKGLYNFYKM